jgi:hypothetical protein
MRIADKNKMIGKNFIGQILLFSSELLFFQSEVNKIGINNEVIRTRGSIGVAAPPQKSWSMSSPILVVIRKIQTRETSIRKISKILTFIFGKKLIEDFFIFNLSNIKNVKINDEINTINGWIRE